MSVHEGNAALGVVAPGACYSVMTLGDSEGEQDRLRARLAELEAQHAELWLSALSVGGGIALDDRRWALEEEVRTIRSRLSDL